jgi:hypothetical protein
MKFWKNVKIDMDCVDDAQNMVKLHGVPALKNMRTGTVGVYPTEVVRALAKLDREMVANCLRAEGMFRSLNALMRKLPRKLATTKVRAILSELEASHSVLMHNKEIVWVRLESPQLHGLLRKSKRLN